MMTQDDQRKAAQMGRVEQKLEDLQEDSNARKADIAELFKMFRAVSREYGEISLTFSQGISQLRLTIQEGFSNAAQKSAVEHNVLIQQNKVQDQQIEESNLRWKIVIGVAGTIIAGVLVYLIVHWL